MGVGVSAYIRSAAICFSGVSSTFAFFSVTVVDFFFDGVSLTSSLGFFGGTAPSFSLVSFAFCFREEDGAASDGVETGLAGVCFTFGVFAGGLAGGFGVFFGVSSTTGGAALTAERGAAGVISGLDFLTDGGAAVVSDGFAGVACSGVLGGRPRLALTALDGVCGISAKSGLHTENYINVS